MHVLQIFFALLIAVGFMVPAFLFGRQWERSRRGREAQDPYADRITYLAERMVGGNTGANRYAAIEMVTEERRQRLLAEAAYDVEQSMLAQLARGANRSAAAEARRNAKGR